MRKFGIILLLLAICLSVVSCSSTQNSTTTPEQTGGDSIETEKPSGEPDYSIYSEAFISACADTGIDISQIKNWERIDDWANGERFRFSYERHSFTVYVNYDETISSIELGGVGGVDIFKQGYVPYAVDDYLVDEDVASSLIPYAQDTIKLALNYPSTADFSWFDWSYGREGSLYQLKSSVKAKNAFGVEDEIPFTVIFDLGTEGKANCVYLELDGVAIANEMLDRPEREKLETEIPDKTATGNDIRLVDGELGQYGKQDPKYPEYVDFYIPAGRYQVKNNAKNSVVMIIDESSNDEVNRLSLATGQSGEIEIKSNQHIELTFYSDVTLTKIEG